MSTINLNDHGLYWQLSTKMVKQYPRVVASVINKSAIKAMHAVRDAERTEMHLTRNFLTMSTQYEAARSKQREAMHATVGILDRVKYANILVDGGTKTPSRSSHIAVPVKVRRLGSGKIAPSLLPNAVKNKKGFYKATIKGVYGIWGTWNGHLTLLYALKKKTHYRRAPYLHFDRAVLKSVRSNDFEGMLAESMARLSGGMA
jgi:hypothetical protein